MFILVGRVSALRRRRLIGVIALAAVCLCGSVIDAFARICRPRSPSPQVVLNSLGVCEFDPETFSFAGTPAEQIKCLLRFAGPSRNLSPQLETVPEALTNRVGQSSGLPERRAIAAHLVEQKLVWDFAPFLWLPLSRARNNSPDAPQARYIVIHDTSAPFIGWQPFPADLDENPRINNLASFACLDDWALAHVFINRMGEMMLSRELSEPWRATKFERARNFGTDLRGLFLHIELIQPRGVSSAIRGRNDARAPNPGFSAAQYERLALVYVIASVRAGRWLIPAFHAALDSGIRGGHDDPQNFDLAAFAASIDRLTEKLEAPPVVAVVLPPPEKVPAPVVRPETVVASTPAAVTPPQSSTRKDEVVPAPVVVAVAPEPVSASPAPAVTPPETVAATTDPTALAVTASVTTSPTSQTDPAPTASQPPAAPKWTPTRPKAQTGWTPQQNWHSQQKWSGKHTTWSHHGSRSWSGSSRTWNRWSQNRWSRQASRSWSRQGSRSWQHHSASKSWSRTPPRSRWARR